MGSVELPSSDLHPFAQPIVLAASLYVLADSLARLRGRDPDRPPHLTKVTDPI